MRLAQKAKQLSPIVPVSNEITKAVRSYNAEFRTEELDLNPYPWATFVGSGPVKFSSFF